MGVTEELPAEQVAQGGGEAGDTEDHNPGEEVTTPTESEQEQGTAPGSEATGADDAQGTPDERAPDRERPEEGQNEPEPTAAPESTPEEQIGGPSEEAATGVEDMSAEDFGAFGF